MESVRFHLKEKIYRCLYKTIDETYECIKPNEKLIVNASEVLGALNTDSAVSSEDLKIILKQRVVSYIRDL